MTAADGELERDILASVLHDGRLAGGLLRLLDRDDFGTRSGQQIFDAISGVAKRDGIPAVSPVMVRDEMKRQGADPRELLAVMDAMQGLGGVGSFDPKCRRLRDHRRLRKLNEVVMKVRDARDVGTAESALQEMIAENAQLARRERTPFADLVDMMLSEHERSLLGDHRIKTGLPTLDRLLGGGMLPGSLAVVGGRTGLGKTLLGIQVACCALVKDMHVLYVALEETKTQMTERVIRHMKRVPPVTDGQIDPLFGAAMSDDVVSLRIEIENYTDLDVINGAIAEMAVERDGLGLVVIDYIGLVRVARSENRVQEISEITRRLKNSAMENAVPILGLAQINRAPTSRTDSTPRLSDLRDSGSLEQDADAVILLARDGEITGSTGQLLLAKNRQGPPGRVPIGFDYPTGRIHEEVRGGVR